MSLPIKLDEKQVDKVKGFVLSYPQLALNVLLIIFCGLVIRSNEKKQDKIDELQDQRYLKSEKEGEKKEELLKFWNEVGYQVSELNKLSRKIDTSKWGHH